MGSTMGSSLRAVALDFDGTLAEGGPPAPHVLAALARFRQAGGVVALVTGRRLDDLRTVFPHVDATVDVVVAENGAVLAEAGRPRHLVPPVDLALDEALRARGVPFVRGEVLVAASGHHADAVREELDRLGLGCQLVRNRGELMVLPEGCSKGTGVAAGLSAVGLSPHVAVGVGDAENDHSLLTTCEVGVAVANAVEGLRRHADVVTAGAVGDGVVEVLEGPLFRAPLRAVPARWEVDVGRYRDGGAATVPLAHRTVLVAGPSGSGKSYTAGALAEGVLRLGCTILVIDPEGDHADLAELPSVVVVGGSGPLPPADHLLSLLRRSVSVVVDLSVQPTGARERFLAQAPALVEAQWASTGTPQWCLVDEAHGPLGHEGPGRRFFTPGHGGRCLVTYRPQDLCPEVLGAVDAALLLPGSPALPELGRTADEALAGAPPGPGEALLVERSDDGRRRASLVTLPDRRTPHARHWHKYVSEFLPEGRRFYFRDGDDRVLGPPAANLAEFHHVVGSCPDAVLRHHARGADFSRWAAEVFRDDELARGLAGAEDEIREAGDRAPLDGPRRRLLLAVERRYLQ